MMTSNQLHVIAAYSNPLGWNSRYDLFKKFECHMADSGVTLYVVECVYGKRPFVLQGGTANHIGVRADTMVWNKECLMNIGLQRLPDDWRYMAWIDADVTFRNKTWAMDTINALQHYAVVQPWSDCYDLGPKDEHISHHKSFCHQFWNKQPVGTGSYTFAHPGYAWAATRRALDTVGCFIDTGAAGAGDKHMAMALVGKANLAIPKDLTQGYKDPILAWQRNAAELHHNIGYVPGTVEHGFHGPKAKRNYLLRWEILSRHRFDPVHDLKRNTWGVWELANNKPELRLDLDRYFHQRNEDGNMI